MRKQTLEFDRLNRKHFNRNNDSDLKQRYKINPNRNIFLRSDYDVFYSKLQKNQMLNNN